MGMRGRIWLAVVIIALIAAWIVFAGLLWPRPAEQPKKKPPVETEKPVKKPKPVAPPKPLPKAEKPAEIPGVVSLGLPIRCTPGKDCWVANYVDVDPSKGVQDYRCGPETYDGHKGTDIAIRDLAAMRAGVPVLAAAPGVVIGMRDGMADVDVRKIGGRKALKGMDCGNGVLIRHADGWSTQYCHMRKGSVTVRSGDKVAAGQQLGLVGLSGRTVFPHVHMTVRHGKTVVDPFIGLSRNRDCGPGPHPLWKNDIMAELPYKTATLYHVGFAGSKPSLDDIRSGRLDADVLPRDAPALYIWVEAFWARPGDTILFTVTAPDGGDLYRAEQEFETDKKIVGGRTTFVGGRERGPELWPVGTYRGEVRLVRDSAQHGPQEFAISREITIR